LDLEAASQDVKRKGESILTLPHCGRSTQSTDAPGDHP
jgi:hypothetical protein